MGDCIIHLLNNNNGNGDNGDNGDNRITVLLSSFVDLIDVYRLYSHVLLGMKISLLLNVISSRFPTIYLNNIMSKLIIKMKIQFLHHLNPATVRSSFAFVRSLFDSTQHIMDTYPNNNAHHEQCSTVTYDMVVTI